MPELPEVESICRSLRPRVVGSKIRAVLPLTPGVLIDRGGGRAGDPVAGLVGSKVQAVRRRGKYILFDLSDDRVLLAHMRMTGQLLLVPAERLHMNAAPDLLTGVNLPPHTHVVFLLASNSPGTEQTGGGSSPEEGIYSLLFVDVRRFGRLELYRTADLARAAGGFSKLGPEPLSPDFSADYLWKQLKRHPAAPIKNILLNQAVVAGLGNIYVDESLFQSGIHPLRKGRSLRFWEVKKLVLAVRRILAFAIVVRGTSFSNYLDADGRQGSFLPYLCVYGRAGAACRRCRDELQRFKVGGRGTVYCPTCQPFSGRPAAKALGQAIYKKGGKVIFLLKRGNYRSN